MKVYNLEPNNNYFESQFYHVYYSNKTMSKLSQSDNPAIQCISVDIGLIGTPLGLF